MSHRIPHALEALRQKMAKAAQEVYDDWEDEGGGICDMVAAELGSVVASALADAEIDDGGWDGDDHAWLIVTYQGFRYGIDIPAGVYETGAGYNWQKKPGVTITAADVCIWTIDESPVRDSSIRLIADKLHELKPVLVWEYDDLRVTAGTSWITVQADGGPPLRRRFSTAEFKGRLSHALSVRGEWLEPLPGLELRCCDASFSGPVLALRLSGVSLDTEGVLGRAIFDDLMQWLRLLDGDPQTPFENPFYQKSTCTWTGRGLELEIRQATGSLRFVVDNPVNFLKQALAALAGEGCELQSYGDGKPLEFVCERASRRLDWGAATTLLEHWHLAHLAATVAIAFGPARSDA